MQTDFSLTIPTLRKAYANGIHPADIIQEIYGKITCYKDFNIFISLYPIEEVIAQAKALDKFDPNTPLWGMPFVVKDNIDAVDFETTAGCTAFAYEPEKDSFAVRRLREAGALLIGKTNLDQFATGLVGTRSPFGPCLNPFNPDYVSGGSSSGSAVAVSLGLASFALGTDTAGSGRVPAAFNNIVGLKPTFGRVSVRGVVPACKSLDCVSIFALTPHDAAKVFEVVDTRDPLDPWIDDAPEIEEIPRFNSVFSHNFKFGLPDSSQLVFGKNSFYKDAFKAAVECIKSLGGEICLYDYRPFDETANLLYNGPWLAERLYAVNKLANDREDAILPVIQEILIKGKTFTALQTFEAKYKLQELQNECAKILSQTDFLLLPTAPSHPTIEAVNTDPIAKNADLGKYTNFVNLLGLCAIAVPAGFDTDTGLPFGISLIAQPHSELKLVELASQIQYKMVKSLGATGHSVPEIIEGKQKLIAEPKMVRFAVCGAHLSGQPLNNQLTERGAVFIGAAKTAPVYQFYALPDDTIKRPGLIRQNRGKSIDLELWDIPEVNLGSFIASIHAPLGVGRVELADGTDVLGFICESYAVQNAEEITEFESWRSYISSKIN